MIPKPPELIGIAKKDLTKEQKKIYDKWVRTNSPSDPEINKAWRLRNRKRLVELQQRYARRHPEKIKSMRNIRDKRQRKENPEKFRAKARQWYANNKDKQKSYQLTWKTKNPESYKQVQGRQNKKPVRKINCNISRRIREMLNSSGSGKYLRTLDYLSCPSRQAFMGWIESQFTKGMTWDNYASKWEIDHIVPVSYHDALNPADMMHCWNFNNLRPLLISKNRSRGNRVGHVQIPLLLPL